MCTKTTMSNKKLVCSNCSSCTNACDLIATMFSKQTCSKCAKREVCCNCSLCRYCAFELKCCKTCGTSLSGKQNTNFETEVLARLDKIERHLLEIRCSQGGCN